MVRFTSNDPICSGKDRAKPTNGLPILRSMSKIQSRLMQESTLAFETAVKIAIAEQAAITSCAEIEPSTSRDSADRVHHAAAMKYANPVSRARCGQESSSTFFKTILQA